MIWFANFTHPVSCAVGRKCCKSIFDFGRSLVMVSTGSSDIYRKPISIYSSDALKV